MYDQIQEHNINRNKIMDQTKSHIMKLMDEKMEEMEGGNKAYLAKFKQ